MQLSPSDPFRDYDPGAYFCELTSQRADDQGTARTVRARIDAIGLEALRARAAAAETELINLGITFTVYSEASAIDRILPFDCIPRADHGGEWRQIEAGMKQRVAALNVFLHDIYHAGRVLQGRRDPRRPGLRQRQFPPGNEGLPGPLRHLCAYLRHRYRPRRGRRLHACWRTMRAHPRASPMWSRTGT